MTADGIDPVTEVQFWAQVTEDDRRTVFCAPGRMAEVKQLLAEHDMGEQFDVHESPGCRPNQILMVDHNALDAAMRQSSQQARRSLILPRDGNRQGAVQREDGHGTG